MIVADDIRAESFPLDAPDLVELRLAYDGAAFHFLVPRALLRRLSGDTAAWAEMEPGTQWSFSDHAWQAP